MTSLNNLNLFDLKNQNKYAQLVEAQSPEPQELATTTSDKDNLAAAAASSNIIEKSKNIIKEDNSNSDNSLKENKISEELKKDLKDNLLPVKVQMAHGSKVYEKISNKSDGKEAQDWKKQSTKKERKKNFKNLESINNLAPSSDNVVVVISGKKEVVELNVKETSANESDSDGRTSYEMKNVVLNDKQNKQQIKKSDTFYERKNSCQTDDSQITSSSIPSTETLNNSINAFQNNQMSSYNSANNFYNDNNNQSSIIMTDEEAEKDNESDEMLKNDNKINVNKENINKKISTSMLELDKSISNNNDDDLKSFELTWKNLTFSYDENKNKLLSKCLRKKSVVVLKDISGKIKSNQLVAIIGPSGCGKTTLLQFLAGNNSFCKDKLNIIGLDEPKVAFIGQDDCLLPGLTAKETLIYASRLQNPSKNFNHDEHIKPIMSALGLIECSNRSVTKLSGGQAKRVTIAQELLYPTNLLILDEVTSGLDASTSYSIVKLLKKLVSDRDYPMTIVMSIHQPSARLFSIFDQVYLMSDGYCLYEGSCKVDLINDYLSLFNLECPQFHNIADYLIEIASETEVIIDSNSNDSTKIDIDNNYMSNNNQNIKSIKEKMILYQKKRNLLIDNNDSTIFDENKRKILAKYDNINNDSSTILYHNPDDNNVNNNKEVSMLLMNNNNNNIIGNSLYEAIEKYRLKRERPLFDNFVVHLSRSMLRIRRSYILTYLQLITYILLGLQLSTFYGSDIGILSGCPQLPMSLLSFVLTNNNNNNNNIEDDSINLEMRRIQENMNFLLVAIMTATFAALEITVITFPLEAKTVKREWRNGWYKVSSYFLGRTLADLPFQLTFVIIFCLIIYILTGQIGLTTWRFGSFVLIIVMTALIAQTVGFIFGAIFMDNLPAAVFTAPLFIFPALLFSGFFSRVSQIPAFYKPFTYLSHYRYAFDALLVTLYGNNRCECDQDTLNSYHESFKNQTVTIKEMFSSLFGSNIDCGVKGSNDQINDDNENSIDDSPQTSNSEFIKNIISNHTAELTTPMSLLSTSTSTPSVSSTIHVKTFEDALVDTVFEHMNNTLTSTTIIPADINDNGGLVNPSDILVHRFSTKITTMLNTRSNFGHHIPKECENFNPYLMTEFDLHNDDLIFGLAMLFVFVVVSRILCNIILNFTIASRTA